MQTFALATLAATAVARTNLQRVSMADFNTHTFTNKVNHSSYAPLAEYKDYPETYQQRYWMNDQFWDKTSGPVFVYICGEWTCSPPDTSMYPFMVGAELNALLITIEHRYYGDSQPFPDWSTENLRYLSSEQALADLAYFIDEMNDQFEAENDFRPDWVTVGGSYPGALSAWFKSQYPDHAIGAWSSSGVIHAVEDFHNFDLSLYQSAALSGEFCPETVRSHYTYIEEAFTTDAGTAEICKIFGIDEKDLQKDDFFFYLADIYTISIQYGDRTGLCDKLASILDLSMDEQLASMVEYGNQKGVHYDDYYYLSL